MLLLEWWSTNEGLSKSQPLAQDDAMLQELPALLRFCKCSKLATRCIDGVRPILYTPVLLLSGGCCSTYATASAPEPITYSPTMPPLFIMPCGAFIRASLVASRSSVIFTYNVKFQLIHKVHTPNQLLPKKNKQ